MQFFSFYHYFREEVEKNTLGSRAAEDLLKKIQPDYWFSGHLHVKFPAVVKHQVCKLYFILGSDFFSKFPSLIKDKTGCK